LKRLQKTQGLITALEGFNRVESLFFKEDGSVDFVNIASMTSPLPLGQGRELRTGMEIGFQVLTRNETGAAMPPEEVENMRLRFQPSVFDSEKIVKFKLEKFVLL